MPDSVGKVTQDFVDRASRVIRWAENFAQQTPNLEELKVPPEEVTVKTTSATPDADDLYPAIFQLKYDGVWNDLDECVCYGLNDEALTNNTRYKGYIVQYLEDGTSVVEVIVGGGGTTLEASLDGCELHILSNGVDVEGSPIDITECLSSLCQERTIVTAVACDEDDGLVVTTATLRYLQCPT